MWFCAFAFLSSGLTEKVVHSGVCRAGRPMVLRHQCSSLPAVLRHIRATYGLQSFSQRLRVAVQICEAFGANRYPFPEEPTRQRQMNAEVTARLRELQTTIEAGVLRWARLVALTLLLQACLLGWT